MSKLATARAEAALRNEEFEQKRTELLEDLAPLKAKFGIESAKDLHVAEEKLCAEFDEYLSSLK